MVDATCGNGHDTLMLCRLALKNDVGRVYTLDIQACALTKAKKLLSNTLSTELLQRVHLIEGSHETFPAHLQENSVKLIAYNLGYLPGGDKALTTRTDSTLKSLAAAQKLLIEEGFISLTCYPGHPEGLVEETALLEYTAQLPSHLWNCCHHRWLNRQQSPSLLIIQKRKKI
ncbi:MAG: class I SAM-dependent methyltransferase [Parachlamydiaceae bacterium]|nr:class I SAM-dependent methyltransferase [Parachlamydiaceae bacterium]